MTLIQKLLLKLRNVMFPNKTSLTQEKKEIKQIEYKGLPNQAYYYTKKSKENALEFQDQCNNELFWNNQGG